MSRIISKDELLKHEVKKFEFGSSSSEDKKNLINPFSIPKNDPEPTPKEVEKKEEVKEEKEENKVSKIEYENLLKRVDELTEKVVVLEMELEEQKKEYERELEKAKDEAYKKGLKEAQDSFLEEIEELKLQYVTAITNLQELEIDIKEKLKKIEEELIETSIIIAQKVIKKEVEENSSKIAKSITRHLLEDIKEDLAIKILVNPMDYKELVKEDLRKNLKIVPDGSIKRGGVILLSKEKNIDGTIETRFKRTLQLIKESG